MLFRVFLQIAFLGEGLPTLLALVRLNALMHPDVVEEVPDLIVLLIALSIPANVDSMTLPRFGIGLRTLIVFKWLQQFFIDFGLRDAGFLLLGYLLKLLVSLKMSAFVHFLSPVLF